jgi:multidrug resistance efflux pump
VARFAAERDGVIARYEAQVSDLKADLTNTRARAKEAENDVRELKRLGRAVLEARGEVERFLLERLSADFFFLHFCLFFCFVVLFS